MLAGYPLVSRASPWPLATHSRSALGGNRRNEGLARALYTAASAVMDVYHAPVAHRTEEGNAFAQAVGGATITYPCDCAGCTVDDDMED